MMYLGIDCASPLNRARAEAAKAAGYSFVGRYLVPQVGTLAYKALTVQEAHTISAAGLGLLCIWETSETRTRGGAAAGRADGILALERARAIGMPRGAIYFAVDFNASQGDAPAIAAYMEAAREEIKRGGYRMGAYGHYWVVEELYERGLCDAFWQCVAWSAGNRSPHLNVYQYQWSGAPEAKTAAAKLGISVDLNQCEDLKKAGIWRYEEDKRMEIDQMIEAMTDEQAARIMEKAQGYLAGMPLPANWDAEGELEEAKGLGITDGSRPMSLASRLETAVMVKRALTGGMTGGKAPQEPEESEAQEEPEEQRETTEAAEAGGKDCESCPDREECEAEVSPRTVPVDTAMEE